LLQIFIIYLYTKIPLSLFKIKVEVEIGEDGVYNIHYFVLLGYKSNGIFKIAKKKDKNYWV